MPIYFVRHGQSESNVRQVFAGQTDDALLTDAGVQQAQAAGQKLLSAGITRIIASPLIRTRRTASEIAKVIGFDESKIEYDQRILEYDYGVLTATPIRDLTSKELTTAKDAENPEAFRQRIVSFLQQYKNVDDTILMVSHGGVARGIEAAKQGIAARDIYTVPASPNAIPVMLDLSWLSANKPASGWRSIKRILAKIIGVLLLIIAIAAAYGTCSIDFQTSYGLFGQAHQPIYVIGICSVVTCLLFILCSAWVIGKKLLFRFNTVIYIVSFVCTVGSLIGAYLRTF